MKPLLAHLEKDATKWLHDPESMLIGMLCLVLVVVLNVAFGRPRL